MNILYDYQIFDIQKIGGISRYFYEIIKRSERSTIGLKYSNNYYLQDDKSFNIKADPASFESFLPKWQFPGKWTLFSLRNLFYNPQVTNNQEISIDAIKNQDYDIFHPTYYNPYFLDYLNDKPFVLTVHDMIHELFPYYYSKSDPTTEYKKLLAFKANHIIAISEQTKKDLLKFYNIPENKISIIYHGSSLTKKDLSNKKNNKILKKRYFLFTGTRCLYKNFQHFIQSVIPLLKKDKELYVICTANDFTSDEIRFFKETGIEKQIIHVFATDYDLYELYHNAIAFVFPSYYEGFGLPILEAFEAECPVLLANASCFPEIARDAALYFDPQNNNEILDCCSQVLNNDSLRQRLIQKGKERYKDFSWDKTARLTNNVYEKL